MFPDLKKCGEPAPLADAQLLADVAAVQRIEAVPAILNVLRRVTGMGFIAIARVTERRWVACSVLDEISFGLRSGGELTVETTICNEIRQKLEPVVIDHVARDEEFACHPTPAMYGFQSYISYPIVLPSGEFFGTLCAIDPNPARLNTPETTGMFKLFAELIALHLDADRRVASSEEKLLGLRQAAELREQFIAVLGHDLRNPLAAIQTGADLLARTQMDSRSAGLVRLIQRSASRMSGLIADVMDFARGRLGGGLCLDRAKPIDVEPILRQVVAELQATSPKRLIEVLISVPDQVRCDRIRIGQLLSNILANALIHGASDRPVRLSATTGPDGFQISVANAGEPIPPAALSRLFQPFSRGAVQPNQEGLGLGLYIASEIAKAHGGSLEAISNAEETRFTFRMPLS